MPPNKRDVKLMVAALFTMNAGLERARRQRKGAGTLSLLQIVAGHDGIRPSDIASLQGVHPSLVTRQIRELEDTGFVEIEPDPMDGRSNLVRLTELGMVEHRRLEDFGLKRFSLFVRDWEPEDVHLLTELLWKLQQSMNTVSSREQRRPGDLI